ncbi:sugar-binding transcriptional regulator [Defluviitalea raffinosedens]|uniref:Sugar-binding transcriptional regulator n=2 Tax=Defluviitalea raffinosedens TaxID=1450156 RepID=A0A7C8HCY8_9FIRM|nr:sugar-binding transcriptional regulator [Defluviitalea raffinosedens]
MYPRGVHMTNLHVTLQKIIPEGILDLERRYEILKTVLYSAPIGRRALAAHLNLSERIVRAEVDFLRQNAFLKVTSSGMEITSEGYTLVQDLEDLMYEIKGLTELEKKVSKILNINKVIIVPGNSDENDMFKKDIGKAAARLLLSMIRPGNTIAITGGSTVNQMVKAIQPLGSTYDDVFVLPARGSVGHRVEYQSNTLASELAQKLGAKYKLLNIPDHLSKKSLESIIKEPEIQDTLEKVSKADILIFGIGNALKMAEKRGLSETILDFLRRKEAVAEAFGYYFDPSGNIVYTSRSVGIKLDDIKKIPYMIAVAGGTSKAQAIKAAGHLLKHGCVVMDEGAANEIIRCAKL